MAINQLAEEFRNEADAERPSVGTRLVRAATVLEHIAQTQEVLRGSCMELSDELIGLADDPRLRARFTLIRGAFSRAGMPPPPEPAAAALVDAPARYAAE